MSYAGRTPIYDLPWWDTGEVSSGTWEERISLILEYLQSLTDSLTTGDSYDGTVRDGFTVSAGAGLAINVAAGLGMVDGIRIYAAGVTAKGGLADASTLYIYLKITPTSFYDRTFTVEASLAAPPMADAIHIATVTTAGGVVTVVDNNPATRAARLRVPGIPRLRVVAPQGAEYTSPKTAIEASVAGDHVLILPGTYDITSTITLPDDKITIDGINRDACILNFTTADANNCLFLNGKDRVIIRCLSITAVASKTGSGIRGTACTDTLLQDLFITGPNLALGIFLDGASDRSTIIRCYITGSPGEAIDVVGGSYCLIAQCVVDSAATNAVGINILLSSYATIIGNLIRLSGSSPNIGITAGRSSSIIVQGNHIIATAPDATTYGILFQVTAASAGRLLAKGNILTFAGAAGIGLYLLTTNPYNLDDCIVEGNSVTLAATGITIADARVRYTLLHGNHLRGCTAGISDAGTSTTSADNVVP